MSPSDKIEATTNSDSKEERESHHQESVKPNGTDQLPSEVASSSATDIPEHGTITNIPLFTAKISTLKCSENDQMKTFDPGETSNNENVSNKQCGYPLKFPLKNNSNSVSKNNKNYKAGSKINKLADMLAKRSQNIVEMTQNVTSDIITDIISAPKVEGNSNTVDISDIAKAEDKVEFSVVFCEETVSNQPVEPVNESQKKSVPNENSENNKQLQSQLSHTCCSNISELLSQETGVSEFNALKEHLIKSETDGSTKNKKEFRKNLKNVELSLILPEKKRRSSPRNKLVNSEISKDCNDDSNQEDKSSAKTVTTEESPSPTLVNEQTKSSANCAKKPEKNKSAKQRKSKRLVETSTQTFTTDFVCIDVEKLESEPEAEPPAASEPGSKAESEAREESAGKPESQTKAVSDDNPEVPAPVPIPEDKPESEEPIACEMEKSESEERQESPPKAESESSAEDVKLEVEIRESEKCVYACMYCPASFVTKTECKDHEKSHSPKKNKQITKCQFCNKHYPSFYDLKLHCIKNHPNKYAYCVKCDERFCEKTLLYSHNKLLHLTKAMEEAQNLVKIQETLGINPREKTKEEIEEIKKSFDKRNGKPTGSRSDLKVDVSFDSAKKSSTSPRAVQKVSPRENKTEEQLLEMEMLFYSHLSGNIKENLTNHLDGKIDKNGNPIQTDLVSDSSENSQAKPKSTNLLSVVTANSSGAPDQVSRAPSPYQTRSKTPNPLPPTAKKFKKLPNWQQKFWEKYNFPTNYRFEHRFWDKNYLNTEKSAFYLKDLSCLDIKTQLTMRENIKKLEDIKSNDESNKSEKLTFPEYLSLIPKVCDGSIQKSGGEGSHPDYPKTNSQSKEEKKSPKTLATDFNKPRRKGSVDNSVPKRQSEKNTPRTPDGSKMMTRRRSVIELSKTSKVNEDVAKRRNGSLDIVEGQKMTLRRQTSLDNLQKICDTEISSKTVKPTTDATPEASVNSNEGDDGVSSSVTGFAEISGEWVRPRSYLCGTCCAKFTNLWELEDHKWVSHPNVWCTHYEFEDEKIDKLFHRSDTETADDAGGGENSTALSKLKLTDLYKRYLLPHGSLKTAKLVPNVSFPEQCTKCKKNCMSLSEMHKHMLDCGGDTTWFLTMYSSPMTIKRKWRPFGSRRRKQIGRRVLKRNIPNTSNMRPYAYQHRIRTKPGDVESIQKMLANLPEKRARRAINFDEIKTRSQATIHSNRLLRKRFKVSFGTNIMRLKALKQQRQAKTVKKESSSKSTTDTSSENTPTGSPKRRNRLKEAIQLPKEETLTVDPSQEVAGGEIKKRGRQDKKKKKKHNAGKQDLTKKGLKKETKGGSNKNGKPYTRSNSSGSVETGKKKKLTESESVPKAEAIDSSRVDLKDKKNVIEKQGKAGKKKAHGKERVVKREAAQGSGSGALAASQREGFTKKKTKTEGEDEKGVTDSEMEVLHESRDGKKGKKGKLQSKNILRLKSNDKEKTELIKRIRKTLRNSKRILEKRENKDKYERRRSLRIQTLQLTEVTPKPSQDIPAPSVKDAKESPTPETKRSRSPLSSSERDTPSSSSAKRPSKLLRSLRGSDSGEDIPISRRSSRNSISTSLDEKPELPPPLGCKTETTTERDYAENLKKMSDALYGSSLEANESELAETVKRCTGAESVRNSKPPEDNSDPLIGFEFESIRKSSRFQTPKTTREGESETLRTCPGLRAVRNPSLSSELTANFESKNFDLSEMPVLDKEEPVRGRTTRKSESDIPVLMPYENEEKVEANLREQKTSKRKGVVTFKVVNKRRRSSERLNPLKIVKETELVSAREKEVPQADVKTKSRVKPFDGDDLDDTNLKKRKRSHAQESTGGDRKCSKSPKAKKYFLGICPNEIDKGGDSKDESGSDSEPLITLVLNQKLKERVKTPPALPVQEPTVTPQETSVEDDVSPQEEEPKMESESVAVPRDMKLRSKRDVKKAPSPPRDDPVEVHPTEETDQPPSKEEEVVVVVEEEKIDTPEVEIIQETTPTQVPESPTPKPEVLPNPEYELKKQQPLKKPLKGLKMTVKLKEATLKIVDCTTTPFPENKWNPKVTETSGEVADTDTKNQRQEEETVATAAVVEVSTVPETPEATETKVERRSRRVSKEIKSTNEFVIDDPLILVDELWSDLDSDSDGSRKRSKKSKKKSGKKKVHEEKKESSVDLEELLRNFGERKTSNSKPEAEAKRPCLKLRPEVRRKRLVVTHLDKRKRLENRTRIEQRSYKRLSLRLFKFHRKNENFGCLGRRLASLKKVEVVGSEAKADLPALPFLAAEIKENPVQIIQCGVQRVKTGKKSVRKSESRPTSSMQLKISLPLQSINNLAVLNNNHLTEVAQVDSTDTSKAPCRAQDPPEQVTTDKEKEVAAVKDTPKPEESGESVGVTQKDEEALESGDPKLKPRRSEVIDKIFYCEICKTYYYSSSQLKIHKLSNRHKMKESELSSQTEEKAPEAEAVKIGEETEKTTVEPPVETPVAEEPANTTQAENVDPEKMNEDTSEMPILEGPFIENPFVRLGMENVEPPPKPSPPPSNVYGFTEDCLKDIQKAIGCTDEEMLILTLLGENSIELESDILDLDSCQPVTSNSSSLKKENLEEMKERESSNGLFKMDFKKRITSALARLVNKALMNILQKYKNTNRTGISPEALSFLLKLSKVNCKKNFLDLDELLKSESEGESSNRVFIGEEETKEHALPYKYFCTICGAKFQKDSTKEWHFLRFHRPKMTKSVEEASSDPVSVSEDDKEETSAPCKYSCNICGSCFQSESSKECHIIRTHLTKGSKTLEEPSSSPAFVREEDKKEQNAPYKYLCTICGSRFQKESMWECHIKRSHKSKTKKTAEELSIAQTMYEDDWSSTWTYDINDELPGSVETPQFLCSDCGINFMSPQEVLEHQKLEHAGQKDSEQSESGPLQSSKIGSSDEILKGRRTPRRTPKHLSSAELDQQRIIAKNELRKLDRKFPNKNKASKVKWGMDALKFTVEKENKAVPEQEEKEETVEETPKPQIDPKNIDIVPKLNLSRTNNIPEFKVVQKTSCLNRFQRLLDNKMKRKSTRGDGKEGEEKETVEKVFVEPVAVVKRERRRKPNRCNSKKDETRKIFDIYDFNDSESEPEPMAFSHVKKGGPTQSPTKLKLVKVKDATETSKNKADSTTKDPETEDYDSEDSLPLSVVKRTRTEEDEEEVRGEDQVEKPEGILEQVEYLIEQLENETNHPKSKEEESEKDGEKEEGGKSSAEKKGRSKSKLEQSYTPEESVESHPETFRVSLENKFLQLESLAGKKKEQEVDENTCESQESQSTDSVDKVEATVEKSDEILPVADSSQGISDDEDSLPLVLMSKKSDLTVPEADFSQTTGKKALETPEASSLFPRQEGSFGVTCDEEEKVQLEDSVGSPKVSVESLPILSSNEAEEPSEKSDKSFETLNGNVIYRRNDSMSGFDSDMSEYETLDSSTDKTNLCHEESESLIKEVMEKEDVVIVCSKKEQDATKSGKKKAKESPKRKKQSAETAQRKKRILPLLSVTLEENNFRKSESPKLKKEVIVKKIWSRRRFPDDLQDENSENSTGSRDNELSIENFNNDDSHSEIDKEIIMKKIWNKKRLEHESENGEVLATKSGNKPEDMKINQTEISDEVVIKCGPKAKAAPKRRKSRSSTKESSKERIMRKIWSGKCTFQTKAALKTYDSDILQSSKDSDTFDEQSRAKRRGRPPNFVNSKKPKILSDGEKSDEDDLDSLLEEIEREEVEKAIRLEFLQLRRSDKASVEVAKESGNMTVGLFAETCDKESRELADRRRKRIRKNVKHPRKNLLKRRKFIRKPTVKPPPRQQEQATTQSQSPLSPSSPPTTTTTSTTQEPDDDEDDDDDGEEEGETGIPSSIEGRLKPDPAAPSEAASVGTNAKSFDLESKLKNRKHKKHRHKHHHHKHKHKKSKHHKYMIGKHKLKHKSVDGVKEKSDEFENFSILEKMCQDIPNQIEKQTQKRFELDTLDTKLDEVLMSTSSSFDGKAKECDDVFYDGRRIETDRNYGVETGSIYEFDEDDSGFLGESKGRHKN